ncbi:MAG TPA: UV DNA damage repair endonuclease UvsE [Polyangia bacterium]|jgi:UV DNA damage endonuclease
MRLGLCCAFVGEPIHFRRTTARYAGGLPGAGRRDLLRRLAAANAAALTQAIEWCVAHDVGAFRVNSEILPLRTHPLLGYELDALDRGGAITAVFQAAGAAARRGHVRLSFHPDQFVVPGSIRAEVAASSLAELEAQATLAELIGAEQITLHGGGAQGGKPAALARLARSLGRLSARAHARLALENDDRIYTVEDLLPVCRDLGLPLVYDAHHHRCHPDGLTIEAATDAAASTWGSREPWAHLSSPRGGWGGDDPRRHADEIRARDVPACWLGRWMTIDVEAKAKEVAVLRLQAHLREGPRRAHGRDA